MLPYPECPRQERKARQRRRQGNVIYSGLLDLVGLQVLVVAGELAVQVADLVEGGRFLVVGEEVALVRREPADHGGFTKRAVLFRSGTKSFL